MSCLPFYYTRFTCTTCFFFGLVLDTYEAMTLPKSCWLSWCCIFFFIILFIYLFIYFLYFRLVDVISKLNLQKASVLRHMNKVVQPILEKGIVDHSIIHRVLMEYFSIADQVFSKFQDALFIKKKKIKTVSLPAFLASAGSFLLFSNLSLLKALCHGCNPTVVESTPYSDDRIQGWIQDCNALCQAWECKGLSLLMTNLKFLS